MAIAEALIALTTVATTAKSLYDGLKQSGEAKMAQTALAILGATQDLQAALLDAQQKNLELQDDVRQLRAKYEELERQIQSQGEYEERRIGQSTIMVKKGTTEPYYCPNCAQAKHLYLPIQPHPMGTGSFGSHYCSSCKTSFRLR